MLYDKKISSKVAGDEEVLLVPISRADTHKSKLYSIGLGNLVSKTSIY